MITIITIEELLTFPDGTKFDCQQLILEQSERYVSLKKGDLYAKGYYHRKPLFMYTVDYVRLTSKVGKLL